MRAGLLTLTPILVGRAACCADPGTRKGPPMAPWLTLRRARRTALAVGVSLAIAVPPRVGAQGRAMAAGTKPCDIYASGGTPCVAAHSTTRQLFGSYTGSLYQ